MSFRLITVAAVLATVLTGSAQAATLKECGTQWQAKKDGGKVAAGETWGTFSKSCMAGAAATPEATTVVSKPAATAKVVPVAKVPVAAPKPAAAAAVVTPVKSAAKTAVADEEDTPVSLAAKKACDAKWGTRKQTTGEHGYKAYFTFMASCL